MEKTFRDVVHRFAATAAAFFLLATLFSCGDHDSSLYYYGVPGGSGGPTVITRDLAGGLTITTSTYPPDYATAEVVVSVDSNPCRTMTLASEDNRFSIAGGCGGSATTFVFDFRYLPASGPCVPGGVYLIDGNLTGEGGLSFHYSNVEVAAWDEEGNPLDSSFRPFGPPALFSRGQGSEPAWKKNDPLNTLGSWTYTVEYGAYSGGLPTTDCLLETGVELTLAPAAEKMAPRVYRYVVTENRSGEQVTVSVTPDVPDSAPVPDDVPEASIEIIENATFGSARKLTFMGLDALRDAYAQTAISYREPAQVVPGASSFADPVSPLIDISQEIDITTDNQRAPLASHLANFLSQLTAPLMAVYGSASPTLQVKIAVYLSKSLGGGVSTSIPLLLFPPGPYRPGLDDNTNCTNRPDPEFLCQLSKAIVAAGSPDLSDSYVFDIIFYGTGGATQPVLRIAKAVVPVAKIGN